MSVEITIIGLGRIGASMGLKLGEHKDKINVTGFDRSAEVTRLAKKIGAVKKLAPDLVAAVQDANLVVLALPLNEMHAVLEEIRSHLREDVLVVDTAPAKAALAAWVAELLPARRHYVGLFPSLNPAVLADEDLGVESARADLFTRAVIAIASPQGTDPAALRLATDLVTVLGAAPFFTDPDELDGMLARVHTLPQLAAESLMQLTLAQPSWDDIRKLAGPALFAGTALLPSQEPAALAEAALANRGNTLRVLDDLIAALSALREDIATGDQAALARQFAGVAQDREKWLQERHKGDWLAVESGDASGPSSHDFLKQQFVGGLGKLFGRGSEKKDQG